MTEFEIRQARRRARAARRHRDEEEREAFVLYTVFVTLFWLLFFFA